MKAEELADLRKRAERPDFGETHQPDAHGGMRLVHTPFYMLLPPSDFRAALTLAQQEARAAALEEAATVAERHSAYLNVNAHIAIAKGIRALLEGK